MTVEIGIPKAQAAMIFGAQQELNAAQAKLNLIVNTVMAGQGVQGQVVSVDSDRGILTVEVPDISPEKTDAA